MEIEIKVVNSKKTLRDFIKLPRGIHINHKNWLPPVYVDEWFFFNPKKNRAFRHCETIMAVAYKNGNPRGRIMGIIHNTYNDQHNERSARFGFFDCFEERETADSLLSFVNNWARQKGMQNLTGPYGFSDKDPQGFQIEGFDQLPLIDTNCNQPYMNNFLVDSGFTKFIDCFTYKFEIDLVLPEVYNRTKQRIENSHRYELIEFTSKKELRKYILPVLRLTNETYSHLYGFYPLNDSEMDDLARRYMPVLDPRFVKIITCNGNIVAYVVGLQNMSAGIIRAHGKLFPFGWYHIYKSMKNATQLDLMLGAVKKEQQGLGLEIWMGLSLLESAKKTGIKTIETHLILETNTRMRSVIERLNVPVGKRFRVYNLELNH